MASSRGSSSDGRSSRDGWKRWDNGRLWSGTYLVRTGLLLSLAFASLAVGAPWTAFVVVAVVIPFNLFVARWHRKRGRAHSWLTFDFVLAAAMACISPQVFVGTAMSLLANSGVGTLAAGRKRVQNAGAAACLLILGGGLLNHDHVMIAFALPLFACCLSVSRCVDYVESKQLANSSRFEDLLNGIHAAVFEIDARTGAILYGNQHGAEMLGRHPSDYTDLLLAVHEEDRVRVERDVLQAMADNTSPSLDFRTTVGEEVRYMEMRASTSRKGEKTRLRLVLVDVSARRKVELEIAHRALHDALTELPNRTFLRERMEAEDVKGFETSGLESR